MSDIEYVPLTYLNESSLLPLMEEEAGTWLSDLDWDYSAIQRVLLPFIRRNTLPGYAALDGNNRPIGYVFFLADRSKGSIGALYTTPLNPPDKAQEIDDMLVELAIACLHDSGDIRRIEAQLFPFHGRNFGRIFGTHGFICHPRHYLVRTIDANITEKEPEAPAIIVHWDSELIGQAAAMTIACYRNHPDYEILEDYGTPSNCENYLHGLIANPGCGVFLPKASFMCLDGHGNLLGYVICSRISNGHAMIPQIASHPAWQGRGLGNAMMSHCLSQLRAMAFNSVSLVVTEKNSRAIEWYRKNEFHLRKEFSAFTWNRS